MPVILTDSKPNLISCDLYTIYGVANPNNMRIDSPFAKSVFRYCPNAYHAINKELKQNGCKLGDYILSRDRIYRDRTSLGQRYFDVYIQYIPIRENSLQEHAKSEHIVAGLNSFSKVVRDKGAHVRVACINCISDYIPDVDGHLDLYAMKTYKKIWDWGVKIVVSYAVNKHPRGSDEYGWFCRK